MKTWKRVLMFAMVAALLLFVAAVVAALALEPAAPTAITANSIDWQVIASGGQTMSSASYTMMSTAGQPVTGQVSGDSYSLLSGYWYGFQTFVRSVLLPFIVGNP